MKVIMLLVLVLSVSCGPRKKVITTIENPFDNSANDTRIQNLEDKVAALEIKVNSNTLSISNLNSSLNVTNDTLENLRLELLENDEENAEAIQDAIDNEVSHYNTLLAMINTLQSQTTEIQTQQAELMLEERVVSIYDPCPSVASNDFKESFFLMSSGKLVAFFESGSNRFLTVLQTGVTYRTTDSRSCIFTL